MAAPIYRHAARRNRRPRRALYARRRARRRLTLSGLMLLVSPLVLVAGLWGTGYRGEPWYGFCGVLLSVALLWASNALARWLP